MTAQILTAVAAILAIIVGPWISYRVAKKNLEFNYRSMVNSTWLDKLDKSVHLFLYSTLEWIEKYPAIKDGSSQLPEPNREIDRMFDSINSAIIKLQLLLDPTDTDQNQILENVIEIKKIINEKRFDEESINDLREKHELITNNIGRLFKKERTVIKKIFD
jgi:hypothetical protein